MRKVIPLTKVPMSDAGPMITEDLNSWVLKVKAAVADYPDKLKKKVPGEGSYEGESKYTWGFNDLKRGLSYLQDAQKATTMGEMATALKNAENELRWVYESAHEDEGTTRQEWSEEYFPINSSGGKLFDRPWAKLLIDNPNVADATAARMLLGSPANFGHMMVPEDEVEDAAEPAEEGAGASSTAEKAVKDEGSAQGVDEHVGRVTPPAPPPRGITPATTEG